MEINSSSFWKLGPTARRDNDWEWKRWGMRAFLMSNHSRCCIVGCPTVFMLSLYQPVWCHYLRMAKVVGGPFLLYAEHSWLTSPLELPVNQVRHSKFSCSLRYLLVLLPSLERCRLTLQSDANHFFLTSPVKLSSCVPQLSSHISKTMLAFDVQIRAGAGGKSHLETWAIQWTRNL